MKLLNLNLLTTKKYLVAVSYGPDSMALLTSMVNQGFFCEVAHVNYKKRHESDEEAAALKSYCKTHRIVLHTDVLKTPLVGNFQQAARKYRYDFFLKTLVNRHLDILLTAHHKDDHVETAYFQFQRHSRHLYYGIQKESVLDGYPLIRPLLPYRKSELVEYCDVHNVMYAMDASNQSARYTRNRHRQVLLAMSFSKWQSFYDQIEQKNNENIHAKIQIEPLLKANRILIATYLTLHELEKFTYWVILLQQAGIQKNVGQSFLNHIQFMLMSRKPNLTFKLNQTWTLYKAYDHLIILNAKDVSSYSRMVKTPTLIKLPLLTMDFNQIFHLKPPFIVRSIQEGDIYQTADFKKKVSRLFIDWKVPFYLRRIWPIFVNQENVLIYVPRYRQSYQSKVNSWLQVFK